MREPRTRHEWQEVVDLAHTALCLDAARQYGLVAGGPVVDVGRCQEILERGLARRRRFVPTPGCERWCLPKLLALNAALKREKARVT